MNRLKGLTIVFENCEEIFIPESENVSVEISIDSEDFLRYNIIYRHEESMNIRIIIPNIHSITYHPFYGIETCPAVNRLMRRDITQLIFSYEDREDYLIYVPYSDADESAPIDIENEYESVELCGDVMFIDINGKKIEITKEI